MSKDKKLCETCSQSALPENRRSALCSFTGQPRKLWVVHYAQLHEKMRWAVTSGESVVWTVDPWLATTFSSWRDLFPFLTSRTSPKTKDFLGINLVTEEFLTFCEGKRKLTGGKTSVPVADEVLFPKSEEPRAFDSAAKPWAMLLKRLEELGREHPTPTDIEMIKGMRGVDSLKDLIRKAGPDANNLLAFLPPEKMLEATIRFDHRKVVSEGLEKVLDEIDRLGTMCDFTFDRAVQNQLKIVREHLCIALDGEPGRGTRIDCEGLLAGLEKLLEPSASGSFDPEAGLPEWEIHYHKPASPFSDGKVEYKDFGVFRGLTMDHAIDKVVDSVHPRPGNSKSIPEYVKWAQLRSELRRHLIAKPYVKD